MLSIGKTPFGTAVRLLFGICYGNIALDLLRRDITWRELNPFRSVAQDAER